MAECSRHRFAHHAPGAPGKAPPAFPAECILSPLPLLMLRVLATDDHHNAAPTDHFTIRAARLDRSTHLHIDLRTRSPSYASDEDEPRPPFVGYCPLPGWDNGKKVRNARNKFEKPDNDTCRKPHGSGRPHSRM